jgi:hypothetical protein
MQEAQRMVQHGITRTELEQYVNALVNSSAQQAAASDTQPHNEMLELTMESLTNGLVMNSNIQAHEACSRPCMRSRSGHARSCACALQCVTAHRMHAGDASGRADDRAGGGAWVRARVLLVRRRLRA